MKQENCIIRIKVPINCQLRKHETWLDNLVSDTKLEEPSDLRAYEWEGEGRHFQDRRRKGAVTTSEERAQRAEATIEVVLPA